MKTLEEYKKSLRRCWDCGKVFIDPDHAHTACPECTGRLRGLSYTVIAQMSGVGYDATFRAITDPGRTCLETIEKIAPAIHVPLDEATEIWKAAKRARAVARFT